MSDILDEHFLKYYRVDFLKIWLVSVVSPLQPGESQGGTSEEQEPRSQVRHRHSQLGYNDDNVPGYNGGSFLVGHSDQMVSLL